MRKLKPLLLMFAASATFVDLAAAQNSATEPNSTDYFQVPLPVFSQGRLLADVSAQVSPDGSVVRVSTEQIASVFADDLGQNQKDILRAISRVNEFASLDDFASTGIILSYSPETLSLNAELIAANRAIRTINLSEPIEFDYDLYKKSSSGFSGYMNTIVSVDQQLEEDEDPSVRGRFDFSMRPFGSSGLRLAGEASYSSVNNEPFQRGRVFLEKELIKEQVLIEAGDLVSNSRNLQTSNTFAGVAIGRDFGLQPGSFTQPTGQQSFLLERNATVDVVSNGQLVRSLDLAPGQYNLDNLGFGDGTNDIAILIRDETGFEELVRFTQFFDSSLLKPGLSEYYLSAGVRSESTETGFDYSDDYVASGFYRRGITQAFSAGASFQATDQRQLLALETTIASIAGSFKTDFAVATGDSAQGMALNVDYRLPELNFGDNGRFFLDASVEWFDEEFEGTEESTSRNGTTEYSAAIQASATLNRRLTISAGASEIKRHNNPEVARTINLTSSIGVTNRLNFFVGGGYSNQNFQFDDSEYFVTAGLSLRFGQRGFATGRYDGRRDQSSLQVSRSRLERVGSFGYTGRYDRSGDGAQLGSLSGSYISNRALLDASYRARDDSMGTQTNQVSLTAGTAIVSAGGEVALSRPISSAFAIVSPHKSLKNGNAYIGRSRDERIMSEGLFGPPVQPNLPAYVKQGIEYGVPGAPIGVDVGPGRVDVVLPVGGGTVIQVGSAANLSVFGVIVDEFGDPIALQSGVLKKIDDQDFEPRTMFTNRAGRFADTSLSSGTYEIRFFNGGSVTFELPDEETGLIRVGTLELRE